jgi:putative endonuclease
MYVYKLRSISRPTETYVGITNNLKRRLQEHGSGASRHTSKFLPWKIECCVWFADTDKARNFEHYLKSGSGRAFMAKRL